MKKNPRFSAQKLRIATKPKTIEEPKSRIIPKPSFHVLLRIIDVKVASADRETVEVMISTGTKRLSHTRLLDLSETKAPISTEAAGERLNIMCIAGNKRIGSVSIQPFTLLNGGLKPYS